MTKKQIILDLGNASSHGNNIRLFYDMVDAVSRIDTKKHDIVFKTQIWKEGNPLIDKRLKSTSNAAFSCLYDYCKASGYQCTSSVFDNDSKGFLFGYKVPFIKIACVKDCYNLIDEDQTYYVSVPDYETGKKLKEKYANIKLLYAVRRYPATILSYVNMFACIKDLDILDMNIEGLSDHTVGNDLYWYSNPQIYECHFALERKIDDPFGNEFVRIPKDLEEIL